MTHKPLTQEWTPEEESEIRDYVLANKDKEGITKALKDVALLVNRKPNTVASRWYSHIRNIKEAPEVFAVAKSQSEELPQFVNVRTAKVYEALDGSLHFNVEEATNTNINIILLEMENADNLYDYIVNNKDKVTYLMNSK